MTDTSPSVPKRTTREYILPWPLDGVLAPGICGAAREPLGAIRFERCSETADHPAGVHVWLAVGPEQGGQP